MAAEMEYLTIGKTGYGEYTEKKSRFLGEIHPAASEEEAAAAVARARKKYYDARHHCYAWVLGDMTRGITATHGSWETTALSKKRRTTESPPAQPAFLC